MSETERLKVRKDFHSFLTSEIREGFKGWKFIDEGNGEECDIDTFAESTADDVMAAIVDLFR